MAPRQTPTPVAAPAAPGHDPAAAATPVDVAILLAEVERLRVAQLGLEEKLQARNDELLAIEARIQVADELPDDFSRISGIGKVFAQRLYAAELRTFRSLAEATPEELAAIVKAQKPLQPDFASWNAQARRLAGMDDGQGQR
jgi:predicted flap endonuclease-1-like 5' DNA nuclease